jgi:hypothetical protein
MLPTTAQIKALREMNFLFYLNNFQNQKVKPRKCSMVGYLASRFPIPPPRERKKNQNQISKSRGFSRSQNSYKIIVSPLSPIFTSSGFWSLIQSKEISKLVRAKTIYNQRPIENPLAKFGMLLRVAPVKLNNIYMSLANQKYYCNAVDHGGS